jgi:hypothetical protein
MAPACGERASMAFPPAVSGAGTRLPTRVVKTIGRGEMSLSR